ncbi:MAG TPA: hypothetical protein VLK25_01440 [Allosphingosinicella sp.]|nr:hypothetical protein [Allosphingosinicella sp.]
MLMAFAAMMGWCGTKWPGWWRGPRPPQPDPWWWIVGLAGAAGGVLAVMVFQDVVIRDGGYLALAATGFFGGVALGSIVDGLGGMTNKQ